MKRVHVAVGVVRRQNDILIAKRPDHVHQGGLWEFPGGKVEVGESVQEALARELFEELGIEASTDEMSPLIEVRHDYSDKQVFLDVWVVTGFSGEPHGREGQPLAWVPLENLGNYAFPEANQRIVKSLQLPARYLITGQASSFREFENYLISSLNVAQPGMVLYRQNVSSLGEKEWAHRLGLASKHCRHAGVPIILSGLPVDVDMALIDGVHFPAAVAQAYTQRPLPECKLLGVSCHNRQEVEQAIRLGANFVTLSPVLATTSHPEQSAKGWPWLAELTKLPVPVYALGGLSDDHLAKACSIGAVGIAAISAWWGEKSTSLVN